jgi:hypothetical protein
VGSLAQPAKAIAATHMASPLTNRSIVPEILRTVLFIGAMPARL